MENETKTMESLYKAKIETAYGQKEIAVYCGDVFTFGERIDILTTSAFTRSYSPTPRTMFRALYDHGVSVQELSRHPLIDLREPCNTWLSTDILTPGVDVGRIGCVELLGAHLLSYKYEEIEQAMINSIRSYFAMLDIASIYNIRMDTVALPLLGSGSQHISSGMILIPLLNECISFLKRNADVKRICFIEKSPEKAFQIASAVKGSYSIQKQAPATPAPVAHNGRLAFISYASPDKNIADNLCSKLEQNGIPAWYAPRDVVGPYAEAITNAIERCTHFIVILSENSMKSEHVLNEIDLAFQRLPNNIKFKPLRIDRSIFTPSFKYYLSRQHWMDAVDPPLEDKLNEFVRGLANSN